VPSTFQFLYRSFFSFRDLSLKLHFSTAELTGNFENHQADLDFSVPVPEIPKKIHRNNSSMTGVMSGYIPYYNKGWWLFCKLYIQHTMVFCFFSLLKLHLKTKKNIKTSLFSLSRSTSPTKFHDNQWKKTSLWMFICCSNSWSGGGFYAWYLLHTGGASPGSEICLPNGDESRTKIPNLVETIKNLEPW